MASHVLRAKIDMASGNVNMRDPVLYRILRATHPQNGRRMVHLPDVRLRPRPVGLDRGNHPSRSARSSSRDHRPLYDWLLREIGIYAPQQIEMARLELTDTDPERSAS